MGDTALLIANPLPLTSCHHPTQDWNKQGACYAWVFQSREPAGKNPIACGSRRLIYSNECMDYSLVGVVSVANTTVNPSSLAGCAPYPVARCPIPDVHLQQQHRSGQLPGPESKTVVSQSNKPLFFTLQRLSHVLRRF